MAGSTSTQPGQIWTQSSEGWDPRRASLAERAARSPEWRQRLLSSLTDDQCRLLRYHWPFWARPNQLPPQGDWRYWAIICGRGWGKTRTGAETVRMWAEAGGERIALVGRTAADVRDTMVQGRSGIMSISHPDFMPTYESSKRRITWPNGTIATCFSAEEWDKLRGPEHTKAWVDELAAWRYMEAWEQLNYGMRVGKPQTVITTTPRPLPILKTILKHPKCAVTRGSTYENRTNLATEYFADIIAPYEGTRIGRQELLGEILEQVEGALWTPALIERQRWSTGQGTLPQFTRIVIGVDPAITAGADRDETGIVVVGISSDKRGFVLDDVSGYHSPAEWADVVLDAYDHHKADCIVVETNRGGDLVANNIRQACRGGGVTADGTRRKARPEPRIKTVRAVRGKETRAEPFVALYERARLFHVGQFAQLEDQMTTWVPGETRRSPDRMDALVWALAELYPAHSSVRASATRPEGW